MGETERRVRLSKHGPQARVVPILAVACFSPNSYVESVWSFRPWSCAVSSVAMITYQRDMFGSIRSHDRLSTVALSLYFPVRMSTVVVDLR